MKTLWKNSFTTIRPISGWPEIHTVSEEKVDSPSYYWDGRFRGNSGPLCFQYTLKGRGICRFRGELFDLPEGKGFLMDVSDDEFCYYYPEGGTEPWNFIFINFHMADASMIRTLTETFGPVHALSLEHPFIQNLLHLTEGTTLMTSAKALEWISLLLQGVANSHLGHDFAVHPLIVEAQKLLSSGQNLDWNVSQLANALKISREHLSRLFQQELGQSPYRFIVQLRMDKAKYLLKSTRLSCKLIAEQCGFETAPLFGRVFKQSQGVTPAKYRRYSGVD
jgi:AraC-like DNA-binding protein